MSKTHNYENPSEAQDLSHLEAQSGKDEYLDEHGWPCTPPMSDRECIYRCLENCELLAELEKSLQKFKVLSGVSTKELCSITYSSRPG